MVRLSLVITFIFTVLVTNVTAWAPSPPVSKPATMAGKKILTQSTTSLKMGFGMPDDDTKPLTRENEPDEFFSSKMDKMDDGEKINVALLGLAGISLPFIAGLIALYAASG